MPHIKSYETLFRRDGFFGKHKGQRSSFIVDLSYSTRANGGAQNHLEVCWEAGWSEAFSRRPHERTKRAQFCAVTQGQPWQGLGRGWGQSLEGVKVLVPGNISSPSEETGVISSKVAVCSVYDALEIFYASLGQHSLISFLLTSFHCIIVFHWLCPIFPQQTACKMLYF